MLHREIPFLRICLPLCAGILSVFLFSPGNGLIISLAVLTLAGLLISYFFEKQKERIVFGLSVSSGLFLSGLLLYINEKQGISPLRTEQSVFVCELSDYPDEKPGSLMATVRLKSISDAGRLCKVNGSMILYLKKDTSGQDLLPGDILVVKCTPLPVTNRGNPCEFDYRFFLERAGIRYYAFPGSGGILKQYSPEKRKLKHRALIIRERIIRMYSERGVSDERLPLVAAITLGEKSRLEQEQKNNFIRAGVMHIMAVSGLHAVILSLFIMNMLFFLRRRFNILRIGLAVAFLWFFAFVTGLTPSVLRAVLMFSFLQAGSLMKRKVNGVNSVLASAFVLIVAKPSVIFDAGFLLSYSAVIFIIVFYRDFYTLLHPGNWITDKIWQSVSVSVVAQLGTLSLTLLLFNRFPVYFILTNIIIVPLSSLVVICGCMLPMLYGIELISSPLGKGIDMLTGLTEELTAKAAALPASSIEDIGLTVIPGIILFALIFMLTAFVLKKPRIPFYYPAFLIALFAFSGTAVNIGTKSTSELIVYNTRFHPVGIRTGKNLDLYSDTLLTEAEVRRHSAVLGLRINMHAKRGGDFLLKANGKRIMITSKPLDRGRYDEDIIVINGKGPVLPAVPGKSEVIFTSVSYPGGNVMDADTIHMLKKSGAYRTAL